ncbi:lactonase family protein [Paraburkholderia megapolitana]|uniref:lactonase family protein n=1 Tax=Paraburkholderia megapolitana TaxID=420953 RepID=UPI0038BD11F5
MSRYPVLAVIAAFFLGLTGCDGSLTGTSTGTPAHSYSYVVAGYLTGQNASGLPVTLVNNGKDTLTLGASGGFQFPTPLANGATYSVTLAAQPYGQLCAVTNGTGTVNVSNVTSILVSCGAVYPISTIGGNVAGLSAGASVTLKNNGSDTVTVSANGAFVFPATVYDTQAYDVTVGMQPAGETCTATQAIGTVPRVNVANVSIVCTVNGSKTYSVGGTVSGLGAGASVALLDNGVDATTVSNNGAFTFPAALHGGASWAVTVGTEPAGETCSVSNANGANIGANVTAVTVACSPNQTYSIEGNVSNLPTGTSVALQNNGSDLLTVPTDGTFIFGTQLASGATYNVTVATQPPGGNCVVSNGSGTVGTASVTAVSVNCVAPPFIYAPVPFSKSIDAFAFNASTGVVTPLALSSVAAGGQAQAIVLNSARTLAYVVLNDKATVVKFAVNASDGTLTPVAGVVDTENDPQDIVITPSGKFAYVANAGSNSVSGYAIDATTGALTPIAGSPFAAGSVPRRIAIDPTGRLPTWRTPMAGNSDPGLFLLTRSMLLRVA